MVAVEQQSCGRKAARYPLFWWHRGEIASVPYMIITIHILLQAENTLFPVVWAHFVGEQLSANTNQVEPAMDIYLL